MSEDLPHRRHTDLVCWLIFIVGTVVVFSLPLIISSYNKHASLDPGSKSQTAISKKISYSEHQTVFEGTEDKEIYPFYTIIEDASNRYQVEPELIQAIIMAESSYNPRAISKKGACGLMQLMPATAEALGVEDSFNPEHNIYGGVKYFKQLLDRFDGNTKMALAAYNAGSTKVIQYNGVPPFKATRVYIEKVFSYYNRYKQETDNV